MNPHRFWIYDAEGRLRGAFESRLSEYAVGAWAARKGFRTVLASGGAR